MNSKLNRYFGIVVAFAVAVLLSGLCNAAQIVSKVEDASAALRVKNGYDTTLTIVVTGAGTNLVVTAGALATTLDGTILTNTADYATAIAACTNTAGTKSLTVNAEPSLAADAMTAKLLNGTYTAAPGAWLELLWDTSVCLHYDLYLPSGKYQAGVPAYTLASVTAAPGGTGNVTASIYKAGTLIARKTVVSPVYVNPATWQTTNWTNSFTADAVVNLDWPLNMPFLGTDAVIVRVARATTATTGVISGVIPNLP